MSRCLCTFVAVALLAAAGCEAAIPGVTAEDCPGAPTDVALEPVAPFYGGLVLVRLRVPGGAPDGIDVQQFDPSLGLWATGGFAPLREHPDGGFVVFVRPQVEEDTRDADQRVRLRTRLSGCAPSAWVETTSFKLGDPLRDTVWVAQIPADQVSGNFNINVEPPRDVGTHRVAPNSVFEHRLAFGGDGKLTQSFAFTLSSTVPASPYHGCQIKLTYESPWRLETREGLEVIVGQAAPSPTVTMGSTCPGAPPSQWSISQPGVNLGLPPSRSGVNVDYEPLARTPAGKPFLGAGQFAGAASDILGHISDVVGPETANVNGFLNLFSARYSKQ
jgi:hypothetical protein